MRQYFYELIQPVCGNTRNKTSNRMAADSLSGKVGSAKRGHHGNMRAEVAAPAHAHSGEYSDIVRAYRTL